MTRLAMLLPALLRLALLAVIGLVVGIVFDVTTALWVVVIGLMVAASTIPASAPGAVRPR